MNILAFDVSINNGENMAKICVSVEGLQKSFKDHQNRDIVVLQDLHFKANAGEITIIMGPSGCGKSTLLNILSTIDNEFENGKVFVMDKEIKNLNESQKADFRNKNIGFIFQSYALIPEFSIVENCAIPLIMRGTSKKEANHKAKEIIKELISDANDNFFLKTPNQLSGGQQQRIAIARALIHEPDIIIADEPTANLDEKLSLEFIRILRELKSQNRTIIVATHDPLFFHLEFVDRVVEVSNAEIL